MIGLPWGATLCVYCLLRIDKSRGKDKTYIWLSVWWKILHVSNTMGCAGRKHSTSSIGCHGHAQGTRSGQTRKTPKDLNTHESEECGCGESVGLYDVYMRHTLLDTSVSRSYVTCASLVCENQYTCVYVWVRRVGTWRVWTQKYHLCCQFVITLRYVNLVELGHVWQFGFREPMALCGWVSEEGRDTDKT